MRGKTRLAETIGQRKLAAHRAKALRGTRKTPAMSPAAYAMGLGITPQRIGNLLRDGGGVTPSLAEALKIQAAARIPPRAWLQAA